MSESTPSTDTDLPRQVGDTNSQTGTSGAVWTLQPSQRQLDANVISLAPGGRIEPHVEPDLDVLVHVVHGSGELTDASGSVRVNAGALIWLPRRSYRGITAGPDGLRYLTVHTRRPGLTVGHGGQGVLGIPAAG